MNNPSYTYALYSYWRSSASWRVRIALYLKNIDFQYIPVHLVQNGGEQHSSGYQAINPMSQVPTLVVQQALKPDIFIHQSMAIIQFLEDLFPALYPLIPQDPILKAKALAFAEIINSGIQPLQNLTVLNHIEALGGNKNQWAIQQITKGLIALESIAKELDQQGHGPFLAGKLSIAELFLIPQLYNARRFQIELNAFPRLLALEALTEEIDAFKKANPLNQIDAQI
jgi:maleylacetoacetate isomerase